MTVRLAYTRQGAYRRTSARVGCSAMVTLLQLDHSPGKWQLPEPTLPRQYSPSPSPLDGYCNLDVDKLIERQSAAADQQRRK